MALNPEITDGIKRYVWGVAAHLGHVTAEERAEILQEVESHLYEGLHARFGETPTLADLEALLAEMPRPESYGEEAGGMPGPQSMPPAASAPAAASATATQLNWPVILGVACLAGAALCIFRGLVVLLMQLLGV
jgi:hypothetical protein